MLIFGYAVNLDVDTATHRLDGSGPHARKAASCAPQFEGSGHFIDHGALRETSSEMQTLLDRGQVDGVIRVLPGFARDIERGRATSVQVLLDGTNSNTASIVSGYAGASDRALFAGSHRATRSAHAWWAEP